MIIKFISAHFGDILVLLALALLMFLIIAKMIKDKKNGKSHCGCGCEHCANAPYCHGNSK